MSVMLNIVVAVLVLLMAPYAVRLLIGPTLFDRVVALNGIGTKVPVTLVMVGLVYDRVDMFVDLALALLLLNLFMTLLISKYVREKGGASG